MLERFSCLRRKEVVNVCDGCRLGYVGAVSYTHLDVYKRQACVNPNIDEDDKTLITAVLNALGQTMYVTEDMFETFTAFCCTGPVSYTHLDTLLADGKGSQETMRFLAHLWVLSVRAESTPPEAWTRRFHRQPSAKT